MIETYFIRPRLDRRTKTPTEIRNALREAMAQKEMVRFFGVTSPIEAIILEEQAVKTSAKLGCYISGAGTSTFFGLPDIGLLTREELAWSTNQIAQSTNLPILVDIDTGYGDIEETVQALEKAGATALHMEDQEFPKRCGHLDGKSVVGTDLMQTRIQDAKRAQSDPSLILMARSDAKAIEGLDGMIARLQAYGEAGADAFFPEAVTSLQEFKALKEMLGKPCLANLTENGKTPLGVEKELNELGYEIVLYPVSFLRAQMKLVEESVGEIITRGNKDFENKVMARGQCMHYLRYDDYVEQDKELAGHGVEVKG
jgi:methylisocitrate lyase